MREALQAYVKRGGELAEHDLGHEDPRRPGGLRKRSNHGAHGKGDGRSDPDPVQFSSPLGNRHHLGEREARRPQGAPRPRRRRRGSVGTDRSDDGPRKARKARKRAGRPVRILEHGIHGNGSGKRIGRSPSVDSVGSVFKNPSGRRRSWLHERVPPRRWIGDRTRRELHRSPFVAFVLFVVHHPIGPSPSTSYSPRAQRSLR